MRPVVTWLLWINQLKTFKAKDGSTNSWKLWCTTRADELYKKAHHYGRKTAIFCTSLSVLIVYRKQS